MSVLTKQHKPTSGAEVEDRLKAFSKACKEDKGLAIVMLREAEGNPNVLGLADSLRARSETYKGYPLDDFMLGWLDDVSDEEFTVVFDMLARVWSKTTPARKLQLTNKVINRIDLRCDLVIKNTLFFSQAQFIKANRNHEQTINIFNHFVNIRIFEKCEIDSPKRAAKFMKTLVKAGMTPHLEVVQELSNSNSTFLIDAFALAFGEKYLQDIRLHDGSNLIGRACLRNESSEMIRRLIELGCDAHLENRFGKTPLQLAVLDDNAQSTYALISHGNYDIEKIERCLKEDITTEIKSILESELARISIVNLIGTKGKKQC